ncbi:phage portal protein [Anaerosalibacter bizertensis]|uniref:phage portal protein n=1 Tax=Anaerosalibacter bizertensis TaxID=932217 RepID=UPI001C0F04BE|nr:phage portal protein [Anaerosalibacter bizertensis]MBU5293115.1 phage portal protein [Anaerosalibacter bizertensis]
MDFVHSYFCTFVHFYFSIYKNICYKNLVVESSVNLIAKTISRAEFQTFFKGKEEKELNYYLLNVEANKNKSASLFWREVVEKLLKKGEALILLQDNQLYLADNFTRKEFVFKENIYTDITINDYELKDIWKESQVLYLKDDNTTIKSAINALYEDYSKLISSSIKGYQKNKTRKGKLKLPTNLPKGLKNEQELQEYISELMKDFMDPSKDAVLPESSGMEYTEIPEAKGDKSEGSGDTRNLVNDVFDFVAISYGIPPSLLKGDTVDTKDAVNNFLTFCINPMARLITDEINRKMYGYELYKSRTYAKLDTSNIKAVDFRDVANSIDLLTRNGALTIDDILRILNKEPIGGDVGGMRFVTKNLELIDRVLKEDTNSDVGGD